MDTQNDSNKTGLIYTKIPAVMADIEAIGKDRTNQQQGFKFRGIDDLYNELHSKLAKHRVFTTPTILGRVRSEVKNSKGTTGYHVINNYRFRFFAEDGSYVDAEADGEAIDWGGDKASNKAASIAHKYALLQVFCIPTLDDKDPDAETHALKGQKNSQAGKSTASTPAGQQSGTAEKKDAFKAVSDDQRKLAFALAKGLGWTVDQAKAKWKEWTKKESGNDWTQEDFRLVIDSMKELKEGTA